MAGWSLAPDATPFQPHAAVIPSRTVSVARSELNQDMLLILVAVLALLVISLLPDR